MPVVGLAAVLHDHVGVRLEDRDNFVQRGHSLVLQHAKVGLGDDVFHQGDVVGELLLEAPEHARRGRARVLVQVFEGGVRVIDGGLRDQEELAIGRASLARGLGRGVLDREPAALRPLEVAVIGGEAGEAFRAPQQPQQHPHAIIQERGIAGRMDRHGDHGAVDPDLASRFNRAGRGPGDEAVIERGQRLGLERAIAAV